jgi:hypothetical protein
MGELATLDESGDTKCMWDKSKPVEVEAARTMFDKLKKEGYSAFRATGEKGVAGELIREFNPDYERIILTPPMAGG